MDQNSTASDQQELELRSLMRDKSLNYKFLIAVQDRDYDTAFELGKQKRVLMEQPENESILRFMKFLQAHQSDVEWIFEQEELEELQEEEEEEISADEEEDEDEEDEEEEVEDDDDWEWEYYDAEEPFPEYSSIKKNTKIGDDQFLQDDNTEGDISMAIENQLKQRRSAPNSNMVPKNILSAQVNRGQRTQYSQQRVRTAVGNSLPKIQQPAVPQKTQPESRPKSTAPNNKKKTAMEKPPSLYPPLQTKTSVKDIRFPSAQVKKPPKPK